MKIYRRVKTPTVLQMEAVECGAAALAIVLEYFGKVIPLEQLRLECGVSRDGSKAHNIVKAALLHGLKVYAYKKEPLDLFDLPFPQIIHWNFNHFVVLEGFSKKCVYLNDPGTGPRTVTYQEFNHLFTGITLTFLKDETFHPTGKRKSMYFSLLDRLKNFYIPLIYSILIGLFLIIPGLVIPIFTKVFIDDFLIKGLTNWIGPLLIGMIITAILRGILTWLSQYVLLKMGTKLAIIQTSQLLWHLLKLPIEFFNQRYVGDISQRLEINDRIAVLLSGQLAQTVLNIISVIFFVILLIQYNFFLTVIAVLISLINFGILKYISSLRKIKSQVLLVERGKMLGVSIGGLHAIETLKSTGRENSFFTKWAGYFAKVVQFRQELNILTLPLSILPSFLMFLNIIFIMTLGGFQVMKGQMTIGSLVAFQTLMSSFMLPFNQLVAMGGILQELHGDMNRMDDIINYPVDPQFQTLSLKPITSLINLPITELTGDIELRNITFGYSKLEMPLIQNFSCKFKPGQRIALIGGSACGKSTISKILTGLYEPWDGEILFNGNPLSKIPRYLFAHYLSLVEQDIFLFKGTIRDNLTLWDQTISQEDMVSAAQDACIHDIITSRLGSYDAVVDENGRNFSGGQRQRLEIARALVTNPSILILDEATSALDPITEKMIDDNIRKRGCTCLIIAHRLSTIRDCDEIIVLDKGQILARGSMKELIDLKIPYLSYLVD